MKTLLSTTSLLLFSLASFAASAADEAATYDLAARDILRTIVVSTEGLSDTALAGWIDENAASELPEAGASVTGGSNSSGYRLTGFRAGRGVTRVRAEYALGDRLVAPADLGEIDWYATYQESIGGNKTNAFLFTGSGDYSDAAIYFACGGDPVIVNWVSKSGTRTTRTYIVSDTAASRPYRLYRSDAPYNNGPVSLAGQYVKVIGDTSLFTLEYGPTTNTTSDGFVEITTNVVRGVYLTSGNDLYSVGDVKGQFLLVYYDSGDFTRVRQVQVIESCTPSVKIVSAKVGEELRPSADGYETKGLTPSVIGSARTTNDSRGDFIYVHETSASYYPHRNAAFALRPTMDEDDTQDHTWDATINWYAPDDMGVSWPFEQTQYSIRWGEGVRYLISTDTANPSQLPIYPDDWQVSACTYQSPDGHLVDGTTWRGTGKSLFKITGTNAEGLSDVAFIQVDAVDAAGVTAFETNAVVGVRVMPVDPSAACVTNDAGRSYLGYIHKPWSLTCYDPDDYTEPSSELVKGETVATNMTTETLSTTGTYPVRSDIYFVNAPEKDARQTLDVWWNVAVKAGDLAGAAYYPSVREKFKPVFPDPDTTPQIVLASMKGSSGTSELYRVTSEGVREMYLQANEIICADSTPHVYSGGADTKDGTGLGWNPNVAHAWCEAGDGGYVCWALRNDMVTHSSLKCPLVYVKGEAEVEGQSYTERKVWTYYVVSTNAAYPKFEANMLVGNQLPGPHPLDLARDPWLPEIYWQDKSDPAKNVAYRDRKGVVWARRDGTLDIHMYYANLNEYKYTYLKNGVPTEWDPVVPSGTAVPWNCVLEANQVDMKVCPGKWTWIADWPSGSPTMQIGRTLTQASDGLAEVWNAASAAVVWPEPTGMGYSSDASVNDVAQLVDPTRNQTASLKDVDVSRDKLLLKLGFSADAGGNCLYRDGVYFFCGLPASLSDRIWYDPNADVSECLVLQGRLDEKTGGVSVLYMNVLNSTERQALLDLVPSSNEYKSKWDAAVSTLGEKTIRPSQHRYETVTSQSGHTYTEFKTTYEPRDHYALASLGGGNGYGETNWVVWIENDADPDSGLNVKEGDAISMHVLRIVPEYYNGQSVTRTDPYNLLSQLLDVLYTEPFGGTPDSYVFEWQSAEPQANGTKPAEDDWRDAGHSGVGVTRFTLGSQGTLADLVNTYYRVRYRANAGTTASVTMGTQWSEWTEPCLAEGWIQRVINSITPFTQRVTDLYENPPETTISMIQQIGGPYQGDVALNMDNMTEVGLLETYVTLLNKAESMSIAMGDDASIDKTSVNKQLMQLVERLDDFYALLGNEAYSDAANPTIAWGSEYSDMYGWDYGMVSSSLFAFDNQVPTLLDEELSLLRGRGVIEDETMGDDVTAYQQKPVYNRLLWNYTRGITEGEVAYALNYNTTAGKGEIDIQAETAAEEYPQGHGDAWGHYLDGLKLWYRLLRNPSFSWSVSMGEMNVDDHAINVDYFEEEKMAAAAASLGKAAERIVDLTARKVWRDRGGAVSAADAGYEDKVPSRAFGYGEWGNKGGVATFVNWMVVNSLLPAADTNETAYTDQGLLKINRSTVGELSDLASRHALIQRRVDRMNDNLNPLGFAENAVPFGVSTSVAEGDESHFEQVLDGAVTALANAHALLEKASASTARLNSLKDASQDDDDDAEEEELDYTNQLISYFGYPYAGDIGVGKTYAQGYEGPDLYHWMYMDASYTDPAIGDSDKAITHVTVQEGRSYDNPNGDTTTTVGYDISRAGLVTKPDEVTGERRAWGSLQYAYAEYLAAVAAFNSAYSAYTVIDKNKDMIDERYTTLQALKGSYAGVALANMILNMIADDKQDELRNSAAIAQADGIRDLNKNVCGQYAVNGTTTEHTFEGTVSYEKSSHNPDITWSGYLTKMENAAKVVEDNTGLDVSAKLFEALTMELECAIDISETGFDWKAELEAYYEDANAAAAEVIATAQAIGPLAEQVLTLRAEAEAILDAREAARQRRARKAAKSRYSEMAHRIWRDEALENYAHAYELAQKYTWLAAKAYDYETGGEITAGTGTSDFLDEIVGTRLPGEVSDDYEPMRWGGTGDAGLSDILARLQENWNVQKGALGINNPQYEMTWFSLRSEAFRILPGPAGLNAWRNKLDTFRVPNLRDNVAVARLCKDLSSDELDEPALIIPLPTTIEFGKNFFGLDLAGGDHQFTTTHFATKIAAAGVELVGYNLDASGDETDVFAATPYVYLIPAGHDRMRSPVTGEVISFDVADQLLEVPNLLGSKAIAQSWSSLYKDLSGQSGNVKVRQYPAFRAVTDEEDEYEDMNATTLIGRSVWNTQWILVIPAGSLRNDRSKALEEFVWGNDDTLGVTDIKIGFTTYSHWGR